MVETGDVRHDGFLIWFGGVDNICREKTGDEAESGDEPTLLGSAGGGHLMRVCHRHAREISSTSRTWKRG